MHTIFFTDMNEIISRRNINGHIEISIDHEYPWVKRGEAMWKSERLIRFDERNFLRGLE